MDQFTINKSTSPPPTPLYHYEPFHTVNDESDAITQTDAQNLDLTQQFTVAAWFNTATNFGDNGMIVNKGGIGSDSAGKNMNYGLWMTSGERLRGGFETSSGTDKFATSSDTFNDGKWHHGVVTFDNPNNIIRLFVDGVQVATYSTSTTPETNATPLRIGSDSSNIDDHIFTGSIDEVGVWNRVLNSDELTNLFRAGTFPTKQMEEYTLTNLIMDDHTPTSLFLTNFIFVV